MLTSYFSTQIAHLEGEAVARGPQKCNYYVGLISSGFRFSVNNPGSLKGWRGWPVFVPAD